MKILEYIKREKHPNFAQMTHDLNLHTDTLAAELKSLKDRECILVFPDGYYLMTDEGKRELKMLKGEKP